MYTQSRFRVCIIGAGVSGLAAVKACLEEGLDPMCYEMDTEIGGVWYHRSDKNRSGPHVYDDLQMNTSKHMSCFSDFPVLHSNNDFLAHHEYQQYLKSYAREFRLTDHIQTETEVLRVQKDGQQWKVDVRHRGGKKRTNTFNAVMLCSGRFRKPVMPDIKGLDEFEGVAEHAYVFKSKYDDKYVNKNVLVIGNGFSGGDIAGLISDTAKKVYWSVGNGTTIMNKFVKSADYTPLDAFILRRSVVYSDTMAETFTEIFQTENLVDGDKFKLAPQRMEIFSPFTLNVSLAEKIHGGIIMPKRHVTEFKKSSVVFDDKAEEKVDTVVMAVGYEIGYPFLEKGILEEKASDLELFELVWPVHNPNANMAIIGCYAPKQPVAPGIELQCRWAARVFAGLCQLPDQAVMTEEVKKRKEMLMGTLGKVDCLYPDTTLPYQDRIAKYIGVYPDPANYPHDEKLVNALRYGPAYPYHYRLEGPHKSDQARDLIIKTFDLFQKRSPSYQPPA